ncbi:baculoviral IAP repeat-containing protein 2-like [Anabas testudineus]|uniref:baculoviral IAP repeat-containing protein 2-like n=1 Tax=Anabas testudineus TaxID=64144 RepID=UPI000E45A787|nr:baculoviral IAP repeat-containing protein 2-like [Anabas testudineus]
MSELDLMNITEHLTDEELKRFKWHLKNEKVDDIEPIKAAQLSKAEREEIVDLMCQKYEVMRASEVMKSILKKLNRNDLAAKLSKIMGTEDPSPVETAKAQSHTAAAGDKDKMMSIRSKFVEKVSVAVIRKLMDKLLENNMITDDEMDLVCANPNRVEKARELFDTVRRKGPAASSALITALCEDDQCLARELNLM